MPSSITYYSVVSCDSVKIFLTILELYGLKVLSCDIQNEYITAPFGEKLCTIAGPKFISDAIKVAIIVRALYGLNCSGASFRAYLDDTLYDIGYVPLTADPDVWMKLAIKDNGFQYW